MAERLEIRTFGGLIIKQGERLIESGLAHKAKALLVYLNGTGRACPRPVLANLLWDQGSEHQLMNNMRVLLSNMRRELGSYVAITRESVAFDRAAPYWLDTTELAQGLAESRSRRDETGRYPPASLLGRAVNKAHAYWTKAAQALRGAMPDGGEGEESPQPA